MKPYRPYVYEEFEQELAAQGEAVMTRTMTIDSHSPLPCETVETVRPDGAIVRYINGKMASVTMNQPMVALGGPFVVEDLSVPGLMEKWDQSQGRNPRQFNQTKVLQQVNELYERVMEAYGPSESHMRNWAIIREKAEILHDFYLNSPEHRSLFTQLDEKLHAIKERLKFFATTTNV